MNFQTYLYLRSRGGVEMDEIDIGYDWPVIPGHAADLSKEPKLPDPNTSFISANEGPPDFTDADGNLTMDGRKMMADALSMAQMSSGIVKFSKGLKGAVGKASAYRNKQIKSDNYPDEFLKIPDNPEIPIGKDMYPKFKEFDRHPDAAIKVTQNDLFKSYQAGNKGQAAHYTLDHYLQNENAIRGAGHGNYQTGGKITSEKFSYIKKDFMKQMKKEKSPSGLVLAHEAETGFTMSIPAGKVNRIDPDAFDKFDEGLILIRKQLPDASRRSHGTYNEAIKQRIGNQEKFKEEVRKLCEKVFGEDYIDSAGLNYDVYNSPRKVTKAGQIRESIKHFTETGGTPEEYDAISELLESLINKRSGK